jgi:hypothetical protein
MTTEQTTQERSSQIGTGIFLIGLALIFLFDFVWPGIMFVVGVSLLVAEFYEEREINFASSRVVGALVVIGIGLLGVVDFNIDWGRIWPLFLIALGVALLFGNRLRGGSDKRKNE